MKIHYIMKKNPRKFFERSKMVVSEQQLKNKLLPVKSNILNAK